MKLRTHFMIAKIAAENSGFSFWERNIFCIGSLIPDLSPMQFIHRHFYASSGEYVQKKLEHLSGRNSFYALLTYGKMAHYVSDFCCSVHADNKIGNVREHIIYERELNQYTVKNYERLKKECAVFGRSQELTGVLKGYFNSKRYDFDTDLTFAVRASMGVCVKAYCPRKTHTPAADTGISYGRNNSVIQP